MATPASQLPPPPPPRQEVPAPTSLAVISGQIDSPQRVLLYGPGGIGKTTLASLAPSPVFIDLEEGSYALDVERVKGIESWADLRHCLQSDLLDGYQTVVIDSATHAQEMAIAHTLATVKTDKGRVAHSLEDYNWGKGPSHVYNTFLLLVAEVDPEIRTGC